MQRFNVKITILCQKCFLLHSSKSSPCTRNILEKAGFLVGSFLQVSCVICSCCGVLVVTVVVVEVAVVVVAAAEVEVAVVVVVVVVVVV